MSLLSTGNGERGITLAAKGVFRAWQQSGTFAWWKAARERSVHIHQVVAAGYLLGHEPGDTATVVKLFRVSLLAWVVMAASLACRASGAAATSEPAKLRPWTLVPWFLWLFLALVLLQSLHGIPATVLPALNEVSRDCLVLAIAALGIKTSFQALFQTGWRPFALLLVETLWLAAVLLLALRA